MPNYSIIIALKWKKIIWIHPTNIGLGKGVGGIGPLLDAAGLGKFAPSKGINISRI